MIKFGIIYKNLYLCKMIETILDKGIKKHLWCDKPQPYGYRINCASISINKEKYENHKDYITVTICINQHDIEFITSKNIRRGYLHYFIYFRPDRKFKYNLYLPASEVLDGVEFFTTTNIERRKLKIKQLKKLI